MRRGTLTLLLFIILLAAAAVYVDLPNTPGIHILGINNPLTVKQGLDLQGGISVLLKPDPKQHYDPNTLATEMPAVRNALEQRVNGGLGVNEPSIRLQSSNGQPAILVELPGFTGNQTSAVNSLLKTGTLEFWNTGSTPVQLGTTFDPTQYISTNPGGKPEFTGTNLDASQV